MGANYTTVTLVDQDGVAYQGHGPTKQAARAQAIKVLNKKHAKHGKTPPPISNFEEWTDVITNGPGPRTSL